MRPLTLFVAACLLVACAHNPATPKTIDDPVFISWYKSATPYMRTAFFMSLCVAGGFSRGSVDITICLSNHRENARIRIEGSL